MRKYILKKGLVLGIIMLFVATCAVSTISSDIKKDETNNFDNFKGTLDTLVFHSSDDTCIEQDIPGQQEH